MSRWHEEGCSDDMYDSDDYEAASTSSGEIPPFREASSPVSSLSDSWSDILATIELNLYDDLAEVEKQQRVTTPASGPCTVQLSPLPTVSCRITPTGETVLSFQWESSK